MKKANRINRNTAALFFAIVICSFSGCATLTGIADGIAGAYMGGLEKARASGASQEFNCTIEESFSSVIVALDRMDAKIAKIDPYRHKILAIVYRAVNIEGAVSRVNNADVGIFLTQLGPNKTKVEISCLSSHFLEHVSGEIFSAICTQGDVFKD